MTYLGPSFPVPYFFFVFEMCVDKIPPGHCENHLSSIIRRNDKGWRQLYTLRMNSAEKVSVQLFIGPLLNVFSFCINKNQNIIFDKKKKNTQQNNRELYITANKIKIM